MEEGISSEAASLAGYLGLGKLIGIYDDNQITIEGPTDLAYHDDVGKRFESYGWSVHRLDIDSSLERIEEALEEAKSVTDRPSLVILPSHIGYGSPNKQDTASAHGAPLGEEEIKLTKEALGWPYEEPFTVPPEVYEHFEAVKRRGIADEEAWDELFDAYSAEHADLAAEYVRLVKREDPELPPLSDGPGVRDRRSGRHPLGLGEGAELAGPARPGADRWSRGPGALDVDEHERLRERPSP